MCSPGLFLLDDHDRRIGTCHCVSEFAANTLNELWIRNHHQCCLSTREVIKLVFRMQVQTTCHRSVSLFAARFTLIYGPTCSSLFQGKLSMRTLWWINWTVADSLPTRWHRVNEVHLRWWYLEIILPGQLKFMVRSVLFAARFTWHSLSSFCSSWQKMMRLFQGICLRINWANYDNS